MTHKDYDMSELMKLVKSFGMVSILLTYIFLPINAIPLWRCRRLIIRSFHFMGVDHEIVQALFR